MTSSVSQLPGATRTERKIPEHGVRKLRQREAQALIGIGTDALSHAYQVGSEVLAAIYDKDASLPDPALQDRIAEVLTCMEPLSTTCSCSAASSRTAPRRTASGRPSSQPKNTGR
jgi:hypothetical protein